MRVLIIADDPEPFRLLAWALRDDGVEAECLAPQDARASDLRAVAALVIATPAPEADARREDVAGWRERLAAQPILQVLDGDGIPDSGADRFLSAPLRHADLLAALNVLALRDHAPEARNTGQS